MEPGCREVRAPGSSFYIAYEYRLDRTACIDRADVSARHRTRPAGLRRCGPPSGGRCRGAAGPIGAAAAHRLRRGAGLPPAARLFSGAAARRLLSGRQFVERLFDAGQGRRGPFGDADRFEQPHHALHDSAGDGFRRAFRRGACRCGHRTSGRETAGAEHRPAVPADALRGAFQALAAPGGMACARAAGTCGLPGPDAAGGGVLRAVRLDDSGESWRAGAGRGCADPAGDGGRIAAGPPVPAPAGGAPHDRHRGRDAERCAGDRRRHLAADLRQR